MRIARIATDHGPRPVVQHGQLWREITDPLAMAAVERLMQNGLLRRTANKSARVPVASADDVLDAYFARRLLEGSAIQ